MQKMTVNPVACAVVAALALGAHSAYADGAEKEIAAAEPSIGLPSVKAGAFYRSMKIERGMVENKESVFGYEAEIEWYGFFLGIESCYDMTNVEGRRGRYNEIESEAGYSFSLGDFTAKAAYVYKACGGDWTRNDAAVYVDATGELPTGTVADLLPDGEPVIRKSGKWSFAKAAGVKLSKDKSRVEWNTSRGNTNLSGLKLTYIPKRGTFKVYALEGSGKKTKLRKHTVRVTGLVVDGIGYGKATCKKPSVSWTVTVR